MISMRRNIPEGCCKMLDTLNTFMIHSSLQIFAPSMYKSRGYRVKHSYMYTTVILKFKFSKIIVCTFGKMKGMVDIFRLFSHVTTTAEPIHFTTNPCSTVYYSVSSHVRCGCAAFTG